MWRTHHLVESVDISENRENRENFEPHLTAAATVIFLDNVAAVSLKFATFSRRVAAWQQVLLVVSQTSEQSAARRKIGFEPRFGRFLAAFLCGASSMRLRFPINNIACLEIEFGQFWTNCQSYGGEVDVHIPRAPFG